MKCFALTRNSEELVGRTCKVCLKGKLKALSGQYGPFIGCSNPDCKDLPDTSQTTPMPTKRAQTEFKPRRQYYYAN